ncbi:major facilitator superfamily domain-containing protein [Crepidotus variabilis]|uniref:Major facilitator superfamily domain-containing protein n=1 Tax=Crepidotus variabilis TaxID=179855 RepID=A0A9P6JVJ4_9AGAR|nr:major facilitator superfamily domain-containing protein [Crepidotus variabilis]
MPPRLELDIPHARPSVSAASSFTEKSAISSPSSTIGPTPASSPSPEPRSTLADPPVGGRQLSTLRLLVIHIGAALTLFLATTDATIVSTSLPTISSNLQASSSEYTWVGVAYLLTQTAFQPLYGKLSDLVGRKSVLFSSICIFAIGSALCGAAQSIRWLIASRALAGIGGGGIVSAVWVITSEIVEVRQRAVWSQALSVTWSCSAVAGPLLGGLFSGQDGSLTGWRWGFYINLPICAVAISILLVSLQGVELRRSTNASWSLFRHKFDFVGLFLFMTATSSIIIGFSFATDIGWTAPSTLILIIIGISVLIAGGFYENLTSRDCLFPPTTFKSLTPSVVLIISFLHNFAFNAGTFYLALYYQAAEGSTPLESGLKVLPYSLGSSLASMPVAWFIGYRQRRTHDTSAQNWTISMGLFISTIGFGLLHLLDEKAKVVLQIVFPLIAGIGIGMLFHAPYQVFTRSLKPQDLAAGTSAFFLVRFTGATIGLAVAGTIFYAKAQLPDLTFHGSSPSIDFSRIRHLPPDREEEVLQVISTSIHMIWTVCTPCLGVSFLLSFLLRKLPSSDTTDAKNTPTTTTSSTDDEKL